MVIFLSFVTSSVSRALSVMQHVAHSTAVLPSTCTLIQLSLTTLLEHRQPSTLGMKKDVGLAKDSAFMLIVLILRKFLVVAGYST